MRSKTLALVIILIASTTSVWGATFHFTATADPRNFDAAFDLVLAAMQSKVGGLGVFHVSPGDIDPPQNLRARIDARFGTSAIWYPGIGNHEEETPEDMTWLRDEYNVGNGGRTPLKNHTNQDGPLGTVETTYSWDHGNAHFIMLNQYWNGGTAAGSDVAANGDTVPALYNWLARDLAENTKPVVFVFGHEPAYPFIRHVGDSLDQYPASRDAFWNLLESYSCVKAFIVGHTHYYSRYQKPGGRVWQIDLGNAGNDGGDGKTFLDVVVTDTTVTYDIWRDGGTGIYTKTDAWGVPVTVTTPVQVATPAAAKLLAENTQVRVAATVSAAFPDFLYIEDAQRISGIRVNKTGHTHSVGQSVIVTGWVKTSADGERYIDCSLSAKSVDAELDPLFVIGRSLGGGAWPFGWPGSPGQRGVTDGTGLNNIGLLVMVCGSVSYAGSDHYYVDDGSGVSDPSGHPGVKVLPHGFGIPDEGSFVAFSGVSSCYKSESNYYRLIHASSGSLYDPVAYNDCVWQAGQYIGQNVTTYGIGTGYGGPTTGPLKHFRTGADLSWTVTLTQSGGVTWQPSAASGGTDTNPGTDAYQVFGGICNLVGVIYYGTPGWWVDLEISGLDPAKTYEFVTTSNRADPTYTARKSKYTISGADAYTNASTSGTLIENAGASTTFCTGYNTLNGYVARWTGINPGADGKFRVRAVAATTEYRDYTFDAFRLAEE